MKRLGLINIEIEFEVFNGKQKVARNLARVQSGRHGIHTGECKGISYRKLEGSKACA
jgi:hypothetical protein